MGAMSQESGGQPAAGRWTRTAVLFLVASGIWAAASGFGWWCHVTKSTSLVLPLTWGLLAVSTALLALVYRGRGQSVSPSTL